MPKRSMTVALVGAAIWGILASGALAAAKDEAPPASAPSSQPVDKRKLIAEAKKALDAAIKDLLQEFAAIDKPDAQKPAAPAREGEEQAAPADSADTGLPRAKSNYFTDKPVPDGLADAALDALKDPIRGANPRAEAYVKWQLLSLLPEGRISDAKAAQKLMTAYQRAPLPSVRPTLVPKNPQIGPMLAGKNKDGINAINRDLRPVNQQYLRQNLPILKYRDELFAKLPQAPAAFEAGFKDYVDRLGVGAPTHAHLSAVCGSVRGWLIVAKPPEIQAVGGLVSRLQKVKGPGYYAAANWNDESSKASWDTGANDAEIRELGELLKLMQTQSRGGAGVVKFKDE